MFAIASEKLNVPIFNDPIFIASKPLKRQRDRTTTVMVWPTVLDIFFCDGQVDHLRTRAQARPMW